MKRVGNYLLPFWILLCLAQSGFAQAWQKDVEKALKEAKSANKPVCAFFYHDIYYQNPARKREDFLVWESPLIKKYLPDFIPVQVNVEGMADAESKYGVISFPTVLFFDPQGHELKSMSIRDKSLSKYVLASRLKNVLNSVQEFALIEQQIKMNDSNPKLVLMYANGLRDRGLFDQAEEQYYRLLHWEGLNEETSQEVKSAYTNMLFYQGSADFYGGEFDRCINTMQRFIAKNPKNEAAPQAKLLMGMALYQIGSKSEGEKILKELSRNKKLGPVQEQAQIFLSKQKGGARR
ncbi:MAG: thioredoxin family protein [Candidatus Omnitrophica bacterium]|nr:thioredoxin family protein [Candidatus Omnitrophota bacterium]